MSLAIIVILGACIKYSQRSSITQQIMCRTLIRSFTNIVLFDKYENPDYFDELLL
jgi:hypothetical protein